MGLQCPTFSRERKSLRNLCLHNPTQLEPSRKKSHSKNVKKMTAWSDITSISSWLRVSRDQRSTKTVNERKVLSVDWGICPSKALPNSSRQTVSLPLPSISYKEQLYAAPHQMYIAVSRLPVARLPFPYFSSFYCWSRKVLSHRIFVEGGNFQSSK